MAHHQLRRANFDNPDEVRQFQDGTGYLQLINQKEGPPVGRATFLPGWRWSSHVRPIAGTELCETAHVGYIVSGRMRVTMKDGETDDLGPGDFFTIAPGHDALVLGDVPCIALDWGRIQDYARPVTIR